MNTEHLTILFLGKHHDGWSLFPFALNQSITNPSFDYSTIDRPKRQTFLTFTPNFSKSSPSTHVYVEPVSTKSSA
jgi:hypothetical protein